MFSLLHTTYLADALESLVKRIDKETTAGKLFLALMPLFLLLLLPVSWSGGEENYFLLAYRRVAPEHFSEFHAAFDWSNARFLTEHLLGSLIKEFGYEHAHTIARLSMALLYTASFSVLFAALKLSVLRSILVIALFLMMGGQLYGGEWLFSGVESKTFAYAAVVAALGAVLGGRWIVATILIGISTYFHFLVGGFWLMALALLIFIREKSFQNMIRIYLIYFVIISPLLVIIAVEQLGQQHGASSFNINSIYAMRVPHHVAPFYSKKQLLNFWSTGVFTTFMMTLAFVVLAKRTRAIMPPSFILILLLYLLLALVISFFDRNTFFFSKFYLFRPSSLILLLAIASVLSVINTGHKFSSETTTLVLRLAAVVVASIFIWTQVKSNVDKYRISQNWLSPPSLITAIEGESKPTEIVLIEPKNEKRPDYIHLHRSIPRPTLVSWKFVPSTPPDLLRWHKLVEFRKSIFEGGCSKPFMYPVRLLLIFDSKTLDTVKNCGDVVWRSNHAYLLRIDDRWSFRKNNL